MTIHRKRRPPHKPPHKKPRPVLPLGHVSHGLDPALSRFRQMLPVQRTWSQFEIPSVDELNQDIRDAQNFLLSPPRVHLQMVNQAQTLTTVIGSSAAGGFAPMTFDTVLRDTDDMWDSNFASRINFNTPGLYKWRLYMHVSANTTAGCLHIGLGRVSDGIFPLNAAFPGLSNAKIIEDTRQGVQDSIGGGTAYIEGHYLTNGQDDYLEAFCSCSYAGSSLPVINNAFFQARFVSQQ